MKSFLVVRILENKSMVVPTTSIYGSVEIRSHKSDSEQEIFILQKSAASNNIDFEKYSYLSRIAVIVKSENLRKAIDLSDDLFSEVLDLKSVEYAISDLDFSKIGFAKDLVSGQYFPFERSGFSAATAFTFKKEAIQSFDISNFIISSNSELSLRYARSLHWSRKARHESNEQLRILFYWFSIEALLKEDINDSIMYKVAFFLGFPSRRGAQYISDTFRSKLLGHPDYLFLKRKVNDALEAINTFRNDSVHSGFRMSDFNRENINFYSRLITVGASRCQGAALYAIMNNITTVPEFNENMGIILERGDSVIDDIHKNVFFFLSNNNSL